MPGEDQPGPPDGTIDIYRKSRADQPANPELAGPAVQDELEVTVANALKLTSWDRLKQLPSVPCVASAVSTGLFAASAVAGLMLIRRRPFSLCANTFVGISTIVSGGSFGLCQYRLQDMKMKVTEIKREMKRIQEDDVLRQRLQDRMRLRDQARDQKRQEWLSGLKPNMASAPAEASPSAPSDAPKPTD